MALLGRGTGMSLRSGKSICESCGPGFFWAWCYCLWFAPGLYGAGRSVPPGQSDTWLIVLASATVVQFAVPLTLRSRRLSSASALYGIVPALLFAGTVCIECARTIPLGSLHAAGAVVSGAASAFLWHLWGDYYEFARNDSREGLALGFGVVLLVSVAITTFAPSAFANAYVAATPIISGSMLLWVRKRSSTSYPPPLPKASRKTSLLAVVKMCLIAFLACAMGTCMWAAIPLDGLTLGFGVVPLGVAAGALLTLMLALPKCVAGERMPVEKAFSWVLFLSAIGVLLHMASPVGFASASYVVSMAATVMFDVLLATYFMSLVVKGYVTSTTAFGYSEGFVCAAMLAGNVLCDTLRAGGMLEGAAFQRIELLFLGLLFLLLILLSDQQATIREILQAPVQESDMERNCALIAKEHGLSQREYEVMLLVGKGHTPKSVANVLFISPSTAQTHIKHIYQKIGVHSRTELIEYVNLPMA